MILQTLFLYQPNVFELGLYLEPWYFNIEKNEPKSSSIAIIRDI